MKKLIAFILALVMCLGLLAGCGVASANVESEADAGTSTSMFVEVERTFNWYVVYHRETKVMYVVSRGNGNVGTFTKLVDADGTPLLWED